MRALIASVRYGAYLWNLGRLGGDARTQFQKCMESEFRQYMHNGITKRVYFDDKTWLKLMIVAYPKNFAYYFLRFVVAIMSPIYKTRIRDGARVSYLFNRIVIKRTQLPEIKND